MSTGVVNEKRGRTLMKTVEDLMKSKRLEIAVHNFNRDPMLLKAILLEFNMESQRVAKTAVVKKYSVHSSLTQHQLLPLLKTVNNDDYNTYNIYWSLSPFEQKLYTLDPKLRADKEEYDKMFKKVKEQFGCD